jgi:hypothetical protein
VIDGQETNPVKVGVVLTGVIVVIGLVARLVESGSNGYQLVQGAFTEGLREAKAGTKTPAVPEVKVASVTDPTPDWASPDQMYARVVTRRAQAE